MSWLRQNTPVTLMVGPFLDDSDGKTPETDLVISQADVRISKAGGAFAACHNAAGAAHCEAGWYALTLDVEDVGAPGELVVAVHIAGALPVWVTHQVLVPAAYDALVAGTVRLPVNVTQYMGDDCPPAEIAGHPLVTLTRDASVPIALAQSLEGSQIAGSVGAALRRALDSLDAAVSTRSSHNAADVWAAADRTLTSFGTLVADVWNALVAGFAAAGSIGKHLADRLDAAMSTRSSHSATDAANATWDASQAQHTAAGSFGAAVAQGGGGATDWTSPERAQIRQALGVDGEKRASASGNLDVLLTRTAGKAITVSSPMLATGNIVLIRSDDYQSAESRQINFTDVGHGRDLAGASIQLVLAERLGDAESGIRTTVAGSIATDGRNAVYSFTLTAAQTAALKLGVNRYFYALVLTLANGHVLTRAQGLVTIKSQAGANS